MIRSASCTTASSWICGRPITHSASRAYFDRPITLVCSLGITPIHSLPMTGQKWWLQAERTVIGPTIISSLSRDTFGKLVIDGATRYRPANTSSMNIFATRRAEKFLGRDGRGLGGSSGVIAA